jgi:uncharacterized protein
MKILNALDLRWNIQIEELKPGIIILVSTLILTFHRYFGSSEFARNVFPGISDYHASLFMFTAAFILLGIVPLLKVKFIFKESLAEYGFQIGNWKTGVSQILILYPLISILLLYPSSHTQEMINFYPLDSQAGSSVFSFLRFEIMRVFLFYTVWEFFFRGFLLFGLRRYVGDWVAVCIQTIPSCLWHIGMPAGEIFASIFGGILFGMMALKSNSILYPFILHCLIGITLDFFIVINI